MLSAFYLNHCLHFPLKLIPRAFWISFFLHKHIPCILNLTFVCSIFSLNWEKDLPWECQFFFCNYLKCLLCIYVCIYYVYYVYILILIIMFAMYIFLSSSKYIFLSSSIENISPYIYRLSPRPSTLFLLLNLTNCSSFHVVQWTSFLHADSHMNLGHFPWVTEEFSTLTIVLSSATNTIILDHFSNHKKDSPYDKHVKEAV